MRIPTTRPLLLSAALMACAKSPTTPTKPTNVSIANPTGKSPVVAVRCDEPTGTLLDAEHAEGVELAELCVKGGTAATNAKVRAAFTLGPNKTLTAVGLRRDLRAAYDTGFVDQIEATARSSSAVAGSVLYITFTESPQVSAITFEGLTSVPAEWTKDFPKEGSVFRVSTLKRLIELLKDDYTSNGWEDVKVDHVATPEANGVRVKVTVVEGPRSTTGKLTVSGAQGGREAGLRKAMAFTEGEPLNDDMLARAALKAKDFYWNEGFLNVDADWSRKPRGANGVTPVTLTVKEGPQFRVGTLRVKGVDVATAKDILASLTLKTGAICRRSAIFEDIEKIRKRTDANGNPLKAEPETEIEPKTNTMNITIAIAP